MNLGSGTITIRSKKKHLLWTGQRAQHVAENYNQRGGLLHVELQQAAQKAQSIEPDGKNQYKAYFETTDGTIVVPLEVKSDIAMIKTGYKIHTTAEKLTKKKGNIGQSKIPEYVTEENLEPWIKEEITEYLGEDLQEHIAKLNKAIHKIRTKKNKK